MMNYITPEIEVIELEMIDVIQTSGTVPGNGLENPEKEDALPVG